MNKSNRDMESLLLLLKPLFVLLLENKESFQSLW